MVISDQQSAVAYGNFRVVVKTMSHPMVRICMMTAGMLRVGNTCLLILVLFAIGLPVELAMASSSSRSQRTAGPDGEMTKSNMKLNKSLTTSAKRWAVPALLCSFNWFTEIVCFGLSSVLLHQLFLFIIFMSLIFFTYSAIVHWYLNFQHLSEFLSMHF